MPIEGLVVDMRMLASDMDPKTYSPMSGSDENMSSPPSVLTTASAGSCTPSSLPSAGSTPSSIQSAGSTPYQFVSQEESTVIKPLTPSDHQTVHPATPDQPITPEPTIASDLHNPELNVLRACKKSLISGIDNTECFISPNSERSSISEDVNERRQDCSCIMCDDKPSTQMTPCKEMEEQHINKLGMDNKIKKVKMPKNKKEEGALSKKSKRKKNRNNFLYQSELSADPSSTGIKIKIKLTSASRLNNATSTLASELSASNTSLTSLSIHPNKVPVPGGTPTKKPVKSRGIKRKSSEISESPAVQTPGNEVTKKKRSKAKPLENVFKWGDIVTSVKGEMQSVWGCKIPFFILEKIFLFASYSEGCIPFLIRMSKVCRLWRDVSVRPKLWHTVDLATNLVKNRHRTEKKLLWLIENRLSKVEDLSLAGWTEAISPIMLRRISEVCPELRSLNVSFCYKLHAENIHSLLFSSTNLQRLDVSNIMGTHKPTPRCAVGQQTLAELAAALNSNFTHLVIANNTLSNVPSVINSLADHCNRLQVLDLSSVETVGRDHVRLDIEKLQKGCPLLRILRLANSLFRLTNSSISVHVSSPGFPELEELSLAVDGLNDIGLNDGELERILKNSNKLRLLDVRGCHNITDSSLVRIPPWDLEHLFLAGGTTPKTYSDRLELVIRKWQHSLIELDLSWTGKAVAIDTALLTLAEEKNHTLQVLNLCGSAVNFEPVRQLLQTCVNLRWLNLTSCRALPRGVKRLHENTTAINKLKANIQLGKFDDPAPDA